MTNGMPESTVATSELVVPKSMPTILLMRVAEIEPRAKESTKLQPLTRARYGLRRFFRMLALRHRTKYSDGVTAIEEIEKTVLALPFDQRVILAESLLGSLPLSSENWSEAEELAEVERREREIESGQVQSVLEGEFWNRIEAGRKR